MRTTYVLVAGMLVAACGTQQSTPERTKRTQWLETCFGPQQFTYEVGEDGFAITQGDIILGTEEELKRKSVRSDQLQRPSYALGRCGEHDWHAARVSYFLEDSVTGDPDRAAYVRDAFDYWTRRTGIRIAETDDTAIDSVSVRWEVDGEPGCHGSGTLGNQLFDRITIRGDATADCLPSNRRTMRHEIGHTLGLLHEHQRPDRDDYVEIVDSCIEAGAEDQLYVDGGHETLGDYDSRSVMHYFPNSFSNGCATIVPAPGSGLTSSDIGGTVLTDQDIHGAECLFGINYETLGSGHLDDDGLEDIISIFDAGEGEHLVIRTETHGTGWADWEARLNHVVRDFDGPYHKHIGNFDGDDHTDVAIAYGNPSNLVIRTFFSDGHGGFRDDIAYYVGDGAGVLDRPSHVGDVDGDGRDDLVFVYQGPSGLQLRSKLSRYNVSDGHAKGYWSSQTVTSDLDSSEVHEFPTRSGDFDNDGFMDLVFVWGRDDKSHNNLQLTTFFSRGYYAYSNVHPYRVSSYIGDGDGIHDEAAHVGDVDGDGDDDLVFGFGNGGLELRTKLSLGNGEWESVTHHPGDGLNVLSYPALAGDYNGDGRIDLVFTFHDPSQPNLELRTFLSRVDAYGSWNGWTKDIEYEGDGPGIHEFGPVVANVDGYGGDDLVFPFRDYAGNLGRELRTKRAVGNVTWYQARDWPVPQ